MSVRKLFTLSTSAILTWHNAFLGKGNLNLLKLLAMPSFKGKLLKTMETLLGFFQKILYLSKTIRTKKLKLVWKHPQEV